MECPFPGGHLNGQMLHLLLQSRQRIMLLWTCMDLSLVLNFRYSVSVRTGSLEINTLCMNTFGIPKVHIKIFENK